MPLVSQSLENLLNGVSDQPPISRLDSHADEEINGLATVEDGLMVRPNTNHVASLSDVANDAALLHPIVRSATEKYRVYVSSEDIVVEDETTGELVDVLYPEDTPDLSYLEGENFRAVTVGDTTLLLNRDVVVRKGADKSASRIPEALLFVRQADYGTTYYVTLNNQQVSYKTVAGTSASEREAITTDRIAAELKAAIEADSQLSNFAVTRFGSTLYIVRSDSADFTISAKDGLADGGVLAIKGSIQRFEDLPALATDGFIVEVTGDPGSGADNYWMVYDDEGTPEEAGVWRETVKPGLLVSLDDATLPHELVYRGSLIPDSESAGAPPAPDVVETGGLELAHWQQTFEGADFADNEVPQLNDHNDRYTAELDEANGGEMTIRTYYDIDGRNVPIFEVARVSMGWTTDNVTLHELDYRLHSPGSVTNDQYLEGTDTVPTGASVYMRLQYGDGTTSPDGHRFDVNLHSYDHQTQPGIQYQPTDRVYVVFDAERMYPGGSTVTVTVDGTPCTHTVTEGDQDGATIATALELLIEAVTNITSSITEPGRIEIVKTSGIATVTAGWDFDPDTMVHVVGAEFGDFTGKTLVNLTDGSSGTITDGNSTVFEVSTLTGGADNTFAEGDEVAIYEEGTYFFFRPASWRNREVGDAETNPFPSFVDRKISDIFFTRGRLGFTSLDNVILSTSDDLFNFFRHSAKQLQDNDPIDIRSSSKSLAEFHSAITWNEDLYLMTTLGQYRLVGDPILSPLTVALPVVSEYENSAQCRPLVLGRSAFFALQKNGRTKVWEYRVSDDGSVADAQTVTSFVPSYLSGSPLMMAGHASLGQLFLLTEGESGNNLYVLCYADEGRDRIQHGWRKWTFPVGCNPIAIDVIDNTLGLVFACEDGQFLETVELDRLKEEDGDWAVLLDRRVDSEDCSPFFDDDPVPITSWTLPYEVDDDEEVYVVRKDTRVVYPAALTSPTSIAVEDVDLSAVDCWIGVGYDFLYRFSPFYYRKQNGQSDNTGVLTLYRAWLEYAEALAFTASVTLPGRTPKQYAHLSNELETGRFLIPLMGKHDTTEIAITNVSPYPCHFRRLDWEGYLTTRHQRV